MRRLAAALTLVLLTACGSDEGGVDPASAQEDDFLGGTCLVLAQDVIAVRELAVTTLRDDPANAIPAIGTAAPLAASEDRLREGESRAGDALIGPLRSLVAAVADIETRLDANTYDSPRYMERVRDTADEVIRVCT